MTGGSSERCPEKSPPVTPSHSVSPLGESPAKVATLLTTSGAPPIPSLSILKTLASFLRTAVPVVFTLLHPLPAAELESLPPPQGGAWARHVIDDTTRGADGTKLADVNADGLPDITTGWEEGGASRVYLNPGFDRVKTPWQSVTVGQTPSVEDAVFADLDGDGNLDVVSSAEGNTQRVYVHWAPKVAAERLDSKAWHQDVFPATDQVTRWMFAEPLQVDGRNGIDLILGGKAPSQSGSVRSVLGWLESPASPREVGAWKWHPLVAMGWTMSILLEDMDGDGDQDLLCSDRYGATRGVFWLENPGAKQAAAAKWKRHNVESSSATEFMFLSTGDIDGDGLRDIAIAVDVAKRETNAPNRHSRIAWFKRLGAAGTAWQEQVIGVPANTGNVKSVAIGDVDGDGRADLIVSCENSAGDRIGVYWLRQDGKTAAPNWSAHNIAGAPGIKFDLVRLLDLDGDGDLDVLTNEEQEKGVGLGVIWYENPLGLRPR